MRSPNSFEQRPQQQERVAVLAADVLAVDEDARIGAQRVADAEHHRFEERRPFGSNGGACLERRQTGAAAGVLRIAFRDSSGSTCDRGGSPANTPRRPSPAPATARRSTAARLGLDHRLGLALEALEVALRDDALGSSRAA